MAFNVSNDTSTYDYMNSFFGNSGSTNQSSGSTSFLSDYFSVKNGTYYKVAKKFYSSDEAKSGKTSTTSAADEKKTTLAKSAAETAMNSLTKLMSDSLYKKVETTDADGNKVNGYDRDAILTNLKKFVEDYNGLVKGTGELEDNSTLKSSVKLVNQTKVYAKSLSAIGVNIKADNTLEIDEKVFGKADMLNVKSMFTGSVSFAKNMQNKIMQIYKSATSTLEKSDGLYSSKATKSTSVGDMFDSMF